MDRGECRIKVDQLPRQCRMATYINMLFLLALIKLHINMTISDSSPTHVPCVFEDYTSMMVGNSVNNTLAPRS